MFSAKNWNLTRNELTDWNIYFHNIIPEYHAFGMEIFPWENTGRFIKLFGFTLDREGSGSLKVKHQGYYIKIIHNFLAK
jgi:hypothetical protein